jgi:hypothetical protein
VCVDWNEETKKKGGSVSSFSFLAEDGGEAFIHPHACPDDVTLVRGHVGPAPTSFLSLRMTPNEYPPLFNAKGGATLFLMCRLFITHISFFKNVNRRWQKRKILLLLFKPSPARCVPSGCYTSIHLFAGGGGGLF